MEKKKKNVRMETLQKLWKLSKTFETIYNTGLAGCIPKSLYNYLQCYDLEMG